MTGVTPITAPLRAGTLRSAPARWPPGDLVEAYLTEPTTAFFGRLPGFGERLNAARKVREGVEREHDALVGVAGSVIRCDQASVFHTWAARGLNPFAAYVDALQTSLLQV